MKDNATVLIETKQNFTKVDEEQLSAYVEYEKALTGNKTVAILANTMNNTVRVWRGVVSDSDLMTKETALRSMDEYVDFYTSKINDKEKVMQNTYKLNELLHRHSIPEKLRSQFVGTCLLALKNGLDYSTPSLTAAQIRTRMYTFNHTFETVFNLEKTMAKVKQHAIEEIAGTNVFSDIDTFKSLASQYKSSRTFITLKPERINRVKNKRSRKAIADMLHLSLDTNGNFAITTAEEASLLIRYLCFKIFQDNETKDVLEANTVTKLSIEYSSPQ